MGALEQDHVVQAAGNSFQIGSLRIDPRAGEVSGPGGIEKLDPKVMGVLAMLADHAHHVVPREDLLHRLWPGMVVSDYALSRCLYELRRQLAAAGASEDLHALIETLPKRGYRLNADVIPVVAAPTSSPAASHRRRWVLGTLVVGVLGLALVFLFNQAAVNTPDASIAVLPFADLSETQDQAYLADGVAEEILDKLNQNTELRVIARTSSFVFRGKNVDVAEITRKLDVTHVLEGSVRRSGDNLRVTAQLIATKDSSHVWSTTFNRRLGDLFAIQNEIAVAVATALRATLSLNRAGAPPARDFAAYDMVKQAEYLYFRRAPGDVDRSVELFEQALESDAHYARAWAFLAGAYALQAWSLDPPSDLLRAKQGRAALRAVELDPSLAIAHARLAQYYWEGGDEELSRKHFDRAIELDPDDPLMLGYQASDAMLAGDFETAIVYQRRALLRDPMNSVVRQNLGVLLEGDGQPQEALATFRTLLEINPDVEPDIRVDIPRLLVLLGRDEEAVSETSHLPAGELRDHVLAFLYRSDAHRKEADAALRRFEAYEQTVRPDLPEYLIIDSIRLAENYAFRGLNDKAFDTLARQRAAIMSHREAHQYWIKFRAELRLAPFLRPLHADSRWAALLAEAT
jgi:TolB-like protein/DNA-binding winged helix-turn-helix (wHTH) protein